MVVGSGTEAACTHRGYGFSSYWSLTNTDTSSSIAVRRGIKSRYCRSSRGSRTCRANRSVTALGHVRSSSDCALGSAWSGTYAATAIGHSAGTRAFCASASTSLAFSRPACSASSCVVANTYSLMKHCFASAPQKPRTVSSTPSPAASPARRRTSRRMDVSSRSRSTSRIVVDSSTRRSSASAQMASEPADPSRSRAGSGCGALHALPERRVHRDQHRADARKFIKQLWYENQCALEPSTRGVELTLREQHAAEIVARLRVIRIERQHLLVELDGLVRLSVMLVPDGLAEQTARGRRPRCSAGIDADALALHSHGSALLSIHPKFPARADRHVIAACASSVEQAAGRVGFADVG